MKTLPTIGFLLVMLALAAAAAADNPGWDAVDGGDYATALRYWRPIAEKGDLIFSYGGENSLAKLIEGIPRNIRISK